MTSADFLRKSHLGQTLIHIRSNYYKGQNVKVLTPFITVWTYNGLPLPVEIIEEVAKQGNLDIMLMVLEQGARPDGNRSIAYARDNEHYYIEQLLISRLSSIDI